MKKSYGKGLASHPGPELCGGDRETIKGGRESLTPDDIMSRLATIGDACDSYVAHKYLTRGGIVEKDYAARGARLSCHPECDNSFSALDRFGRVVDQKWHDHGASEVRDQYRYGYDRAGNRLYRENTTTTGKDEFHGYDAINRLIAFDRGDLNAGKTAISGTPVREEDWTLDPLGNWPGYVQKTSGTTDLDQSRTHNEVNEITAIAATTGTDWADPVHDRAGNMTTIPKPSSPADALPCQYDAWNRLVEVMDGQTLVGQYRYDGLNRRIQRYADTLETHVHYFYNSGWQVLETRETGTPSAPPETVQPKHQYAWSLRYIDAPILRDENTDADGLCDDERLYYLGDANFNVTTLVNGDGDAVEHYVYEPYGQVTFYDDQWEISGTEPSYGNTCLYTGRESDAETRLQQYRNRYYQPTLGVFLCRDPMASDDNPYRYVGNSPILCVDPNGLWGRDIHKGWTVRWAKMYFLSDAADVVGNGDQWVDSNPDTGPLTSAGWPYHFDIPTPANHVLHRFDADSRGKKFNASFDRSLSLMNRGDCGDAFFRFGMALHPMQDYYAHGNWEPAVGNSLEAGIHPGWYDEHNRDGNTSAKIPIRVRDNRNSVGIPGLERRMLTHQHTRAAIEKWISKNWQAPCRCLCWLVPQFRPKRCSGQADNPPSEYAVPAIAKSGYDYFNT